MTRDEILAEIEQLSTVRDESDLSLARIALSMYEVVELAGKYAEVAYDQTPMHEAVVSALKRFTDMVAVHAP